MNERQRVLIKEKSDEVIGMIGELAECIKNDDRNHVLLDNLAYAFTQLYRLEGVTEIQKEEMDRCFMKLYGFKVSEYGQMEWEDRHYGNVW